MLPLKKRLKSGLIGVLLVILAMPAWSAAQGSTPRDKPYLFLGNVHYPPFIYRDAGQPNGLVADLARAVIEKGGIPGEFDATEWKQAQADVRGGTADALVLINKTPEREAYLDFSKPLITSSFVFFRKSGRVDITGTESLDQKMVGVERGGYTASIMRKFPGIQVREVSDLREGFDLVGEGAIDALITERWAGMHELARREIAGIALIERPVETSVSYIAVRKGEKALLEKVNLGLDRIELDGTRQMIFDRWSGQQVLYVTRDKIDYYRTTQGLAVVVILLISVGFAYSRQQARLKRETIEKHNNELELRVASRTRDLVTARAEAERATASRTQFMANISHGMRTPLQIIVGFAAIGRHRLKDLSESDLAEYLDRISDSGQQMSQLVDSMLTLAESSWKDYRVFSDENASAIGFDTLVAECIETFKVTAGKRNQVLELVSEAKMREIDGDAARLRQVVSNLIENAVSYAPPGSTITLKLVDSTLPAPDQSMQAIEAVALEVIDSGPGIPVAELNEIFEPFYQGSHTATNAGGTGLGLPICRKVVAQHGGTLTARNRPEGGAIFEVKLPCSHLPETETPVAQAEPDLFDISSAQQAYGRCARILIEALCGNSRPDMKGHELCPFGLWLSGPGQPLSLFQQYHELIELHARLHAIAEKSAEMCRNGYQEDAQRTMDEEYSAVSRQMIALIDSFRL